MCVAIKRDFRFRSPALAEIYVPKHRIPCSTNLRIAGLIIEHNSFQICLCSVNLNNFHTKFMVAHVSYRSDVWVINASRTQKN